MKQHYLFTCAASLFCALAANAQEAVIDSLVEYNGNDERISLSLFRYNDQQLVEEQSTYSWDATTGKWGTEMSGQCTYAYDEQGRVIRSEYQTIGYQESYVYTCEGQGRTFEFQYTQTLNGEEYSMQQYGEQELDENGNAKTEIRSYTPYEIKTRVYETADKLDLTPYLDKLPKELSGGQMQRVALGRAIIKNVPVFLMDEPLSNLDAKLRLTMRSEIVKLHNRINELGVAEPVIAQQGADRIVVQLPGVQDTAKAKDILGRTATLEVRMVDDSPEALAQLAQGNVPFGDERYFDRDGRPILVKRRVVLTGENLNEAAVPEPFNPVLVKSGTITA